MEAKTKLIIKEWVQSIVIAFVLALVIRTFFFQAYKIPTGSMKPALMPGDRIMVNKLLYKIRDPERGEIVVFKSPVPPKRDFVKRLAAKEGEKLEIKDGNLIINSEIISKPEIYNQIYYYKKGDFLTLQKSILVPEKNYFMLGDNSLSSQDSRYWGFVKDDEIIGKAFLIYWPLTRIRFLKP